ncbi:MAG: peptidylprolyl isomerase [Thermoanaerobaculia bacterium]
MIRFTPFPFLIAMALAACNGAPSPQTPAMETETAPAVETATAAEEEKPMSHYTDKLADIKTGKGTITIRFSPDKAPNHVRNFIDLAEEGYYDGVRFHRVIPGFMIQGGDPNTKTDDRGSWGTGGTGKYLDAEFNDTPHRRGIVSMARAGHPNSASSQFFIVVKDSNFLDGQYTVFGEVVSGMDIADAIVEAGKGKENPDDPVKIESIEIRAADQA